jgi:ribosomal protein S18 acetylase RimI-like enzyme
MESSGRETNFSYNAVVSYLVRDFEPADFEALWQIDQACFVPGIAYSRRELLTYIGRKSAFTLVAQRADAKGRGLHSGDGVGGFITADAGRSGRGHIITIDVVGGARRSGLGSLLLRAAEDGLKKRGCTSVVLETAVDNVGALAFYKRHNYFLVKTIPHYYANGVDAFVLKKDLPLQAAGE